MASLVIRPVNSTSIAYRASKGKTPAIFEHSTHEAKTFWEFFAAKYRNKNTRTAYLHACFQFSDWCAHNDIELSDIEPMHVAGYIELLGDRLSVPSVKQHLTAIKKLFDHLVINQVITMNPASSVASPRHSAKEGQTPILTPAEMAALFKSIELKNIAAYRDRAIIAVMAYSFARVSAVCALKGSDYYTQSKRSYFKLTEKGSKKHRVPAHHTVQQYVDEYIEAAGIIEDRKLPLFRTMEPHRSRHLTTKAMNRSNIYKMVKRRCRVAGLPTEITNHSFRGTGITTFMLNGGSLEIAAEIAGHVNPTTTKLYDRTKDKVTLDEIERILY